MKSFLAASAQPALEMARGGVGSVADGQTLARQSVGVASVFRSKGTAMRGFCSRIARAGAARVVVLAD